MAGELAILGVRIDPGDSVRTAESLDSAVDRLGDSAESTEKKLAGLSGQADVAAEGLTDFGAGASSAGSEIGAAGPKAKATGDALGKVALIAGVVTIAAEVLGGAFGSLIGFLGDSANASDRARDALDRIKAVGDELKVTVGDEMAPAIEELADVFERLTADPVVVEMFRDLGGAAAAAITDVAELVQWYRELMEVAAVALAIVETGGDVDGVLQAQKVLALQRAVAEREARERRSRQGESDLEEHQRRMEKFNADLERQAEKRRRDAEQRRREGEKLAAEQAREAQRVQTIIDRYDTEGAVVRQLSADEQTLNQAIAEGTANSEDLATALGKSVAKRIELIELDPEPVGPALELLDTTEKQTEVVIEGVTALEKFGRELKNNLSWAHAIGDAFGGWDTDIGAAIKNLANFTDQLVQTYQYLSQNGNKGTAAIAGAQIGGSIGGMGQQFGLWQGNRGRGSFGGRMSGDYGQEGAAIGGMIGGVIGAVAGAGVFSAVGAMIGSAIGGLLGGVIGGAIKRGADEGLAEVRNAAGKAEVAITKDEGGLGGAAGGLAEEIVKSVTEISAALGGALTGIADINLKIRDDIVSVVVDGVKRRFKEVDEAIAFAVTEALKKSEISGMDSMIRAGLQNTNAESLEELQSDMDSIRAVLTFGLGESAMAAREAAAEIDVLRSRMVDLLGGTQELGRALGYLAEEELRRWDDSRDQLTGQRDSPAEIAAERERDRVMWNAERTLRMAEITLRRDQVAAEIARVKALYTVVRTEAEIGGQALRVKNKLMVSELNMLNEFGAAGTTIIHQSLATLEAQLAAYNTILDQFPAEIQPGEMRGGRGGGGFGGVTSRWESLTDRWEAAQKDLIDNLRDIALGESTTALTGRERSQLAKDQLDALIGRAQRGDVAAIEQVDDAFRNFAEIYKTFTGGGTGFLGDFRDLWTGYRDTLTELARMPRPGRLTDGNMVFDRRFHEGQQEHIREARAHRREARDDIRALTMAVEQGNAQQRQLAQEMRRNRDDYEVRRTG